MINNFDEKINFPHELLLTKRQVASLCKAFANNLSTDIKLWKPQLSKMVQSGRFIVRLLSTSLKPGLSLMRNVIKPLTKSVLIPLGVTTAASISDAGIHKKILGSGTATLVISNDEMEDIIKIVKRLEDSGLLSKGVSERKLKNKEENFLICY